MLALLDLRHQEWVLRICRERAAGGDAVVVVLHDLGLDWPQPVRTARRCSTMDRSPHRAPLEVFTAELLSRVYRQPVEVVIAHPPLVPASGCVFPN